MRPRRLWLLFLCIGMVLAAVTALPASASTGGHAGTHPSTGKGKPQASNGARKGTKPANSQPAHPATVTIPTGWPKLLMIPKLKVRAAVEPIALNKPADFSAPYHWSDVAWYDRGPRPGEPGRATVIGHYDSTCCPAAFYYLDHLKKNDLVQVTYRTGQVLTFKVMWQGIYLDAKLPTKFIFQNVNERGLVLLTCSGDFHYNGTGYDHKRMVYARMVLPNGKLG